jgi:short subunit dehydrogenase-like uncharacterized protein
MDELAEALHVSDSAVKRVVVDVMSEGSLQEAMRQLGGVKVVINTIGPYWRWGTPVVQYVVVHHPI